MCLSYPGQVRAVESDGTALVEIRGATRRIPLLALADDAPVVAGEWLLVQTGLAVARISAREAAELTDLIDEVTGGQDDQ